MEVTESCSELDEYANEVFALVGERAEALFRGECPAGVAFASAQRTTRAYLKALMARVPRNAHREVEIHLAWKNAAKFSLRTDRSFAAGCEEIAEYWKEPEEHNIEGCLWLSLLKMMTRVIC